MSALHILKLNAPGSATEGNPNVAEQACAPDYFPLAHETYMIEPPADATEEMELNEGNLTIVKEAVVDSGAEFVSIVACMGAWRTGKSFFLTFLLHYLEYLERQDEDGQSAARETSTPSDWRYWSGMQVPPAPWRPFALLPGRSSRGLAEGATASKEATSMASSTTSDDANAWEKLAPTPRSAFSWRGGTGESCTNGVWIYPKPFVFTRGGKRIAVLVMDTQGAWDPKMTGGQNMTIAGLTTLLSSKLIYNNMSRINADKIDQLDAFCQVAKKTGLISRDRRKPEEKSPAIFGDLEFLIRDWAGFRKKDDMAACQQTLHNHMQQAFTETRNTDREGQVSRIEAMFRDVRCFGLNCPGRNVAEDEEYGGEMDLMDPDFLVLLDEALRTMFGGDFPRPSAPLGRMLRVEDFDTTVKDLLKAFRAANNEMVARGLRDTMIHAELYLTNRNLLSDFQERMCEKAPDEAVLGVMELEELVTALFEEYDGKFRGFLHETFGVEDNICDEDRKLRDSALNTFQRALRDVGSRRVERNNMYIAGGQMKLFVAAGGASVALWCNRHPVAAACALSGGEALHAANARERAARNGGTTAGHMAEDWKAIVLDRPWRMDVLSMWVAAKHLRGPDALQNVRKMIMDAATRTVGNDSAEAREKTPLPV